MVPLSPQVGYLGVNQIDLTPLRLEPSSAEYLKDIYARKTSAITRIGSHRVVTYQLLASQPAPGNLKDSPITYLRLSVDSPFTPLEVNALQKLAMSAEEPLELTESSIMVTLYDTDAYKLSWLHLLPERDKYNKLLRDSAKRGKQRIGLLPVGIPRTKTKLKNTLQKAYDHFQENGYTRSYRHKAYAAINVKLHHRNSWADAELLLKQWPELLPIWSTIRQIVTPDLQQHWTNWITGECEDLVEWVKNDTSTTLDWYLDSYLPELIHGNKVKDIPALIESVGDLLARNNAIAHVDATSVCFEGRSSGWFCYRLNHDVEGNLGELLDRLDAPTGKEDIKDIRSDAREILGAIAVIPWLEREVTAMRDALNFGAYLRELPEVQETANDLLAVLEARVTITQSAEENEPILCALNLV